jgi:transposase
MLYVGIDVHWRTSTYCILDERGGLVKQKTVRGGWDRLMDQLRQINQPMAIGYEASCGYGTLHDQLKALANVRSITVAHPGRLRLIFRSKRKNDQVDAKKLALLLMLDQMPAVHVPAAEVRHWRGAIEYRQRLVQRRTRTKNALRSLLRGQGIVMPRGLWTKKGLAWLGEVELPGPIQRLTRMQLLDELAQHQRHLQEVERELDRIGQTHPGVQLLQTIPGVGPRTSEAVVAYIDDPARFSRNKTIGAYFGLVPTQDASAAVNRLGHITREGPATVRRLITEAAWQGIRRDATVKAYFERLRQGREDRRKLALVGTAHYLLRVMVAMLRSGEVWRAVA